SSPPWRPPRRGPPAAAGSDRGRSGRGPARTVRGRRSRAPCRARRRRAARPVPADRPRRHGGGRRADRRARGRPWRPCPRGRTARPGPPAPAAAHHELRAATGCLPGRPRRAPIRIAHLGGGALTLVRYVQATRPGSPQVVVEIERELPTLVTTALPLPRDTGLEVVIGDAREELAAMEGRRFDAIVLDVFSGEESPAHLTTKGFYLEAIDHL